MIPWLASLDLLWNVIILFKFCFKYSNLRFQSRWFFHSILINCECPYLFNYNSTETNHLFLICFDNLIKKIEFNRDTISLFYFLFYCCKSTHQFMFLPMGRCESLIVRYLSNLLLSLKRVIHPYIVCYL